MPQILRTFHSAEHEEMQEQIACPLCGSTSGSPSLLARDLVFARPGRYALVRCGGCGLQYVNPRPTGEALGAHYPEDYFGYAIHEKESRLMRGVLGAFARGISLRRIGYLEKVTGRIAPETRVLDVGCGVNHLLYHLKQARGCEGLGLDFKTEIVAHVKERLGMPILCGTLQTAGLQPGRFDIVTMMEYLEHEPDPLAVLREARRVTRDDGYLALELPHLSGLPARVFGSLWWNLDIPRHLVFFTPETLKSALERTGFELLRIKTFTFPFYVGMSLVQALGQRNWARNRRLFPLLSAALGAPFLPFQFLLPEFYFAVARAR
jgi:SAM-dependent methyltransferase